MKATTLALAIALVALAPMVLYVAPALAGGSKSYTVLSNSMAPAFRAGDFIVDGKFERGVTPIEPGDPITYKLRDGVIVTHRVVSVSGPMGAREFTVKGDANPTADATPVRERDVVGVYMFSVPYYGYLSNFATKPLGRFVLIIVPSAAFIVLESLKVARMLKAGKTDAQAKPAPTASERPAGLAPVVGTASVIARKPTARFEVVRR